MMTKEQIKNELGEFYINIDSEKNKDVYLDVINKFINLQPYFKPPQLRNNIKSKIKNFCESYGLYLLDSFYFTRNVSYQIRGGDNTFFICVDGDNIKHIYVIRGAYAEPKEINNKLALNTLIKFYEAFVYNVISPSKIIREIKEVKLAVKNFKYPTCVRFYNDEKKVLNIYKINTLKFDDILKTLLINCKVIQLDYRNFNISVTVDRDVLYNVTTFDQMMKYFKQENFIEHDELNELIKEFHELKIEHINTSMNKIIASLNEHFFNKN